MIIHSTSTTATLLKQGALGAVLEVTAHARLSAGSVMPLAMPDAISGPDRAERLELAEMLGVPIKPRADLLLTGSACAPGGRAVPSCRVAFAVGEHRRELLVLGDRTWDPRAQRLTEPKPFTTLPLTYERAYGGPAYADNPVGRGHIPDPPPGSPPPTEPVELPNVLDPEDAEAGRVARRPAGFAPLSRAWGARRQKGGTYDERWLRERWPEYPADLNPSFFNAAPPELQVPYLRGDEKIVLENLHPEHPRLETSLPGLRVRCFVLDRGPQADLEPGHYQGARFTEVSLHLDTLFVDMTLELVTMAWRGSLSPAPDDDDAQVFVFTEPLSEPPRPLDHYHQAILTTLVIERPEPVELPEVPVANENEAQAQVDAALKEALAPIREMLVKGGVSASVLEAFDSGDMEEMTKRMSAESGLDPAEGEKVVQKAQDDLKKLLVDQGHDLSALEPSAVEPALPVQLTREDVIARHRAGEGLADQVLSGLDLSELDLSGADFSGAFMDDVRLSTTRLAGADLSGCILTGADFSLAGLAGAKISGSDLTGANFEGADLTGADLTGSAVRDANLQKATLTGAKAPTTAFQGSDLSYATLAEADLAGAYLDSCTLEQTSFHRANLAGAVLERSEGTGVDFSEADLTQLHAAEGAKLPKANLLGAKSARSIWTNADLRGADLAFTVLTGADFSGADLEGASLHGADLHGANLERTNLTRVAAQKSRFFRASLLEANLEHADFRDACLYEAELMRSRREGARFDGAQLDGTKLAAGAPALPEGI